MATATEALTTAWGPDDGGVWVNPDAVRFGHSDSGTCIPECPWFGLCHCFCGERPSLADPYVRRDRPDVVPGRPYVYRKGHRLVRYRGPGGHGSRQGVNRDNIPHERVRPLLEFLEARYGPSEVARLLEMDRENYRKFRRGKYPTVQGRVWRRIQAAVLAHRRPADPWRFEAEENVRVIPAADRRRMDLDAENERKAAWRHGRRAT